AGVVAGEAGSGRTRLAAELALLAERDAAVVLAGRCDEHLGVPHLPLREALGATWAGSPTTGCGRCSAPAPPPWCGAGPRWPGGCPPPRRPRPARRPTS